MHCLLCYILSYETITYLYFIYIYHDIVIFDYPNNNCDAFMLKIVNVQVLERYVSITPEMDSILNNVDIRPNTAIPPVVLLIHK